jgi:tRNA G18 (ribose-2'-O)-methylase SpoU
LSPTPAELLASLPREALVLVLSGIANHDNMGGMFRNAAAFGAVTPSFSIRDCCDPLIARPSGSRSAQR